MFECKNDRPRKNLIGKILTGRDPALQKFKSAAFCFTTKELHQRYSLELPLEQIYNSLGLLSATSGEPSLKLQIFSFMYCSTKLFPNLFSKIQNLK